jgi:dTDP-4-amino-4,6-dideoxygalactose transaminase
LIARAVIMSGAYERNWAKHDGQSSALTQAFGRWQNRLPLYNMRMSNLAAAIVRAQIPEIDRRVRDGRAGHDHVAARLNGSPWLEVPPPLPPEARAPDSIQFNLVGMADADVDAFTAAAEAASVKVQVFGRSTDNARAFWNWRFIEGGTGELPRTREMLMRACDVRLPARLRRAELDFIADALIGAAAQAMDDARAYGT